MFASGLAILVKYPVFPFPLITSNTNWNHSQKLDPFNLCCVIYREVCRFKIYFVCGEKTLTIDCIDIL